MATTPGSVVDQVQTYNDQMAKYNSDKSKFIDTGGAFPDINTYVSSIDYSEIHRFTSDAQTNGPSTASGTAIDAVHEICSIQRETAMRFKGKSSIYNDYVTEARTESDYYSVKKVAQVNTMSGTTP